MDVAISLQEWLDKNGICVEDYDESGGAEMFVNPHESASIVLKAIIEKE